MNGFTYEESVILTDVALAAALTVIILWLLNYISYGVLKNQIVGNQLWDLNICCGRTDGGGVNADIVRHADVPNYVSVSDIYNLPFRDKQFETTLCSHTIEHVDNPKRFFNELQRVSKEVVLIIPPIWDLSAAFNLLEHRTLFLTLSKRHTKLPPHIPLPLAGLIQRLTGQWIRA